MSPIEDVSDTALWVAMYRAQESERPDALFHDPLAAVLAGERGKKIAAQMSHGKIMAWVMVSRTTAIDRLIEEAVEKGVDTVLNLGAGLDSRPYRMKKLPATLRWIEVDFPKMIDFKNEKLKGEKPLCRLERIGIDLSNASARQELFKKIDAEAKRVLVITEGVIPYLKNEDAASLARDLAAISSFEFWIQDFYNRKESRRLPGGWRKQLKAAPLQFSTPNWFEFFSQYGWVTDDKIFLSDEAAKNKRPFPFIFPWSIFLRLTPRSKLLKLREASGYVRLKKP